MRAEAAVTVSGILDAIVRGVPEYRRIPKEAVPGFHAAVGAVYDVVIDTLATGRFPTRPELEAIGGQRAEQRIPLDRLHSALTIGHSLGWQAFLAAMAQLPADTPGLAAARDLAEERHVTAISGLARQMESGHQTASERIRGPIARQRLGVVADLLTGQFSRDHDVRARAAGQGLDLRAAFALVLLVVSPSRGHRPDLRAAARALDGAVTGVLAVRFLDEQPPHVACLLPAATAAAARGLRRELAGVLRAHPAVSALMALAPGERSPLAYHEHYAMASDVAPLAAELYPGGIVEPGLVELLSALSPDAARLRAFARRVCGDLLTEPAERRGGLVACALAYYANGQSAVETANALRVDRQTVRRRLDRVQQLTGRRVDRDHLALSLALSVIRAEASGGKVAR